MNWNTLISAKRFGLEEFHQERHEKPLGIPNVTMTALSSLPPSAVCRTKPRYSLFPVVYSSTTD